MTTIVSRREILAAAGALAAPAKAASIDPAIVKKHDERVASYLKLQTRDPASRWCGGLPDAFGLHYAGSAAGCLDAFTAAVLCRESRFHDSKLIVERMKLAADFLNRSQNAAGFYDLPITNFNSPPDTAFGVHSVATACLLAKRAGASHLVALMEPFLRKAGAGLAVGGVHTPNHRWVICSALAQINELYPDSSYIRRIDQWLAEGIDIDEDGQYTERSTLVYNAVTNRALIVMAAKLGRPELLEPVRANLNSLLYLLHPGHEVVTEISTRQDLNQRGDVSTHWFALRYMAAKDNNGQFAALAGRAAANASLSALMEYPELSGPQPALLTPPENYEKQFTASRMVRIRRGMTSATILLEGRSRIFALRRGEAVINAVRFASAFFGKGQFVPSRGEKLGSGYRLYQSLEGPYYQPVDPLRKIGPRDWAAARPLRRRTEVCRLEQSAVITEKGNGFDVRIQVSGTKNVPVTIEINLRKGGKLEGCIPGPELEDSWLLASGQATYRLGSDAIRFAPGLREHSYTQVRNAEPKLPGSSVYLCGFTPLDHTLTFEW